MVFQFLPGLLSLLGTIGGGVSAGTSAIGSGLGAVGSSLGSLLSTSAGQAGASYGLKGIEGLMAEEEKKKTSGNRPFSSLLQPSRRWKPKYLRGKNYG